MSYGHAPVYQYLLIARRGGVGGPKTARRPPREVVDAAADKGEEPPLPTTGHISAAALNFAVPSSLRQRISTHRKPFDGPQRLDLLRFLGSQLDAHRTFSAVVLAGTVKKKAKARTRSPIALLGNQASSVENRHAPDATEDNEATAEKHRSTRRSRLVVATVPVGRAAENVTFGSAVGRPRDEFVDHSNQSLVQRKAANQQTPAALRRKIAVFAGVPFGRRLRNVRESARILAANESLVDDGEGNLVARETSTT